MNLLNLLRLQWDRTVAVVAGGIGLLALLLGYLGTSGTPHVAAQLPYFISGGLFGIFCLTIAGISWLSADLRDEWRELRAVRELLEAGQARATGDFQVSQAENGVAYLGAPELHDSPAARNGSRRPRKAASAAGVES